MNNRKKLPNRRASEVIEMSHVLASGNVQQYFADISKYDDGSVAEIFLDMGRQSNEVANLARDAAMVLSIALQHGIPIEEMRASVGRDETGLPHSVIGTALDLVANESAVNETR